MNETSLYWVGRAGAFDKRNQQVARAITALLETAGVPDVMLGTGEKCCGDPARRLGNESCSRRWRRRTRPRSRRPGPRPW